MLYSFVTLSALILRLPLVQVLSLISDSSHLCEPTQCASERMTMLSMEAMTQYICLGYLCVPHEVNDGRPMQVSQTYIHLLCVCVCVCVCVCFLFDSLYRFLFW